MESFDLCVIGSGTGNSIVEEELTDRRIALIDPGEQFGGPSLDPACLPTEMLVHVADLARAPERAQGLGIELRRMKVDWAAIRGHIVGRLDPMAEAGELARLQSPNVTRFRAEARFVGPRELQVGEDTITADAFVLAAGSRPVMPDLPGLTDPEVAARVHTSDTILGITDLPRSLVIVGGGVVAAEFAHVFSALGTRVTVLHRSDWMLRREDRAVAERFTESLASRVNLRLHQNVVDIVTSGRKTLLVATEDPDGLTYDFETDLVLVAAGRVPNSDLLDLGAAGVEVAPDGRVVVDKHQQTTVKGIYAYGDICSPYRLPQVAEREARVVLHNIRHPRKRICADLSVVPHAVFSDPQIAAAGLTEDEARIRVPRYVTSVRDFASVGYGWALEGRDHFVKLIADPATKQLVGAHILGPDAATLLQPLVGAMSFGIDVPTMASGQFWVHPALTEVVKNALLGLELQ